MSSALTLLVGWQEEHPACKKTEWWDAGMVMCLGQGADLHMTQLMPLHTISCSSKSRLVLPFWCRLIQVVLDKIQAGRKMIVCVCMCSAVLLSLCDLLLVFWCVGEWSEHAGCITPSRSESPV